MTLRELDKRCQELWNRVNTFSDPQIVDLWRQELNEAEDQYASCEKIIHSLQPFYKQDLKTTQYGDLVKLWWRHQKCADHIQLESIIQNEKFRI